MPSFALGALAGRCSLGKSGSAQENNRAAAVTGRPLGQDDPRRKGVRPEGVRIFLAAERASRQRPKGLVVQDEARVSKRAASSQL